VAPAIGFCPAAVIVTDGLRIATVDPAAGSMPLNTMGVYSVLLVK